MRMHLDQVKSSALDVCTGDCCSLTSWPQAKLWRVPSKSYRLGFTPLRNVATQSYDRSLKVLLVPVNSASHWPPASPQLRNTILRV
jgi:hypothetical protein